MKLLTSLLLCLGAGVNAASGQSYQFTVTDLGSLGGSSGNEVTWPLAINAAGTVVGFAFNPAGDEIAFSYANGVMTPLGTLPEGVSSSANAINSHSEIVGSSNVEPTPCYCTLAFSYTSGTFTDLGTLANGNVADYFSSATGVNESGVITGASYAPVELNGTPYLPMHAFVYMPPSGPMSDLGVFPGSDAALTSYSAAINSSGTIVGSSGLGTVLGPAATHAFMYPMGGTMTDLGVLQSGLASYATAINDSGQIVGYSYLGADATGGIHAFLYSKGVRVNTPVMMDMGVLGGNAVSGYVSAATGINASGVVVGNSTTNSSLNGSDLHAFIYTGNPDCVAAKTCPPMVDLNNGIDPSLGVTLISATGINNAGQIAATGTPDGGQHIRGYLLNPVCGPFNVSVSNTGNNGNPGALPFEFGVSIYAQLTPNTGTTLPEMAVACGLKGFSWQQQIVHLVCPSGHSATPANPKMLPAGTVLCPENPYPYQTKNLSAPPAFFDPPEGGYAANADFNPAPFAIYVYTAVEENQLGLLWYQDEPSDFCLQDPHPLINYILKASREAYCGTSLPPLGEYVGFVTSLVGIVPGNPDTPSVPICQYTWTSTYNGKFDAINPLGVPIQTNTCTSQTPAPPGLTVMRYAENR